MTEFELQIFAAIHQIPKGKVATYGDIAKLAGFANYARQVGKVLSRLPSDTKLPWFRVINARGYISLTDHCFFRQKDKLSEDGIEVSDEGEIDLKRYRWSAGSPAL
ncbi:MAG: MGMT family protein [Aliivibrio sp.]|uniref:MGMT family protein n=1 Tax=Aliivibrio sp. TaxID=1872443 RepID=UPI001A617600|nr:MGMT family protein [Aliivibrio sp.]